MRFMGKVAIMTTRGTSITVRRTIPFQFGRVRYVLTARGPITKGEDAHRLLGTSADAFAATCGLIIVQLNNAIEHQNATLAIPHSVAKDERLIIDDDRYRVSVTVVVNIGKINKIVIMTILASSVGSFIYTLAKHMAGDVDAPPQEHQHDRVSFAMVPFDGSRGGSPFGLGATSQDDAVPLRGAGPYI